MIGGQESELVDMCVCSRGNGFAVRWFAAGIGHSGTVLQVQISPDQRRIVSVGAEGAILFWNSPPELARDMRKEGYVPKVSSLLLRDN